MRVSYRLVFVVLVGLLGQQCSKSTEPNGPDPTPVNLTAAEQSLLESSNRFGLKLFREIASREEPDSNIFISPLSVSYALGMVYNGAAGETREAIASTLEMSGLTVQQTNQSYHSLTTLLTQLDATVVFNIANSIWYRLGLPVEQGFINLNQTYFDALVRELDFNAPWAADTINHWVDVNTNGKIDKVIDPPIDPSVLMYLINAIYFKGAWMYPFDTTYTYTAPFHLPDGSETECRMMTTDDSLRYFENELFQAVDLLYGKGHFSMTILLPKPSVTVDSLIGQLTVDNWASWIDSFSEQRVYLGLPKFKFEYDVGLNEMLKVMGMGIAFSGAADFSNMITGGGAYIDSVIHKTFVQVDEEGTEAAAVTVIVVCSMPPPMINDRPFLFVIHEHESGTILFMGKVANPVWND